MRAWRPFQRERERESGEVSSERVKGSIGAERDARDESADTASESGEVSHAPPPLAPSARVFAVRVGVHKGKDSIFILF